MNFDGTNKALCGNCSGVTEYGAIVKCGHCGNPLSEKSVDAFREQEYRHRTECDDQKSSELGASHDQR